jgi:hypothetical protein
MRDKNRKKIKKLKNSNIYAIIKEQKNKNKSKKKIITTFIQSLNNIKIKKIPAIIQPLYNRKIK